MSIEKFRGMFTPICDGQDGECGAELVAEYSHADAVVAMVLAGWKSVKLEKGGYLNLCPTCRKDERYAEKKQA